MLFCSGSLAPLKNLLWCYFDPPLPNVNFVSRVSAGGFVKYILRHFLFGPCLSVFRLLLVVTSLGRQHGQLSL